MREELLNHLLFHKSLISEEDNAKINRYLEIAKNISHEKNISIIEKTNTEFEFDRELMLIFELIINNEFDPWDIDLVKFSRLYLAEIKKRKDINLIVAGCIVLKAWNILKMQSDAILEEIEKQNNNKQENISWDAIPDWFEFENESDFDYTERLLRADIPIREKIRRKGKQRVTFIELLNAFEKAKEDAKRNIERYKNLRVRQLNVKKDMIWDVNKKVHRELGEEDLTKTWNKILEFDGKPIPFSVLWKNGDKDLFVSTMMSLLFLANENKISLWQENFPYGEIFVKKIKK